jgi:hypothetical protein
MAETVAQINRGRITGLRIEKKPTERKKKILFSAEKKERKKYNI